MILDIAIGIVLAWLALKLSPFRHWVVQWPGYLLRQITILLIVLLITRLYFQSPTWTSWDIAINILGIGTVVSCAWILIPYTRFGKRTVPSTTTKDDGLSIVISNLQFDNTSYAKAIEVFRDADPDLLVLLELTPEWKDRLLNGLNGFNFKYLIARDDAFGMGVFSKHPIGDHRIYHIYNSTPTLQCTLDYNGYSCDLWILHPKPPAPGDAETSEPLDFEFRRVSDMIDGGEIPTIVAGDLNEVAWSRTTLNFLKRADLRDVRRGRGTVPTFPTYATWMAFPLDQVFVSKHWQVSEFSKLSNINSDHYPLVTRLVLESEK